MRAWLAAQLNDPTSALHAHGFTWLNIGMMLAAQDKPGAPLVLSAAFGCFVSGGTMDLVQLFARK